MKAVYFKFLSIQNLTFWQIFRRNLNDWGCIPYMVTIFLVPRIFIHSMGKLYSIYPPEKTERERRGKSTREREREWEREREKEMFYPTCCTLLPSAPLLAKMKPVFSTVNVETFNSLIQIRIRPVQICKKKSFKS